jgi:ribosomal protein L11 methyltransferase
MDLIEIRVIFDADNIEKAKNEIIDTLYEFGISGVKIDEPMERNVLDFYKNEKDFVSNEYAVSAYFPNNPYTERRKKLLKDEFETRFGIREDMIYNIDFYELHEDDYKDAWKKYVFTEKISDKFVVKPTWREYIPSDDELLIEIDPGRAFGTGTHPTTYLCVQMMEKYIKKEDSVIDVGTGSGILMVAAEKLGAKEIWGVDIDRDAVEVAEENLILNKVDVEKTKVFHGDLLNVVKDKKFDVVVANILADVIIILLKDISRVVDKDGIIILSGIIKDKKAELMAIIKQYKLEIIDEKEDKDWVSLVLRAL